MVLTAIGGGGVEYQFERFTASGTWTKPDNITWVLVSVVGGGSGGGDYDGGPGAANLVRRFAASGVPDSVAVTVGAGGAAGSDGGTSRFGELAVATGGYERSGIGGGTFDPNTSVSEVAKTSDIYGTTAGGGRGSGDRSLPAGGIWAGGRGADSDKQPAGAAVYGAGGGGTDAYAPGNHSGVIAVSNGPDDGAGPDAPTDLCAGGGGSSGGNPGGVPGGGGGAGGGEGGRGEVRVWSW